MGILKRGCAAFLASTMVLGLLPGMSAQAAEEAEKTAKEVVESDFDAYRAPSLSGPIQTWVYQGEEFDYENSKNQVFADDQEDGDLTKSIIQKGFVDTAELGDQTVIYEVTDSDGNKSTLETTVTVLAKDSEDDAKKNMKRILYTLPDASHLTNIGFNRGYGHDRQNLGFWLPAGETLTVRLVNHEDFSDELEPKIQLLNHDSWSENLITVSEDGSEGEYSDNVNSVKIPKTGEWVTVKNKCKIWETVYDDSQGKYVHRKTDQFHYVDSVPFIYTPKKTPVQPIIEIKWNDAFQSIPYYRYGDDEESFFNDWDTRKSPYAIIEGQAATFLIPMKDRNNIIDKQGKDSAYSFHTIDGMLEWYAGFVTQYDAFSGLDFYTDDPSCQNVRAKFFIKANQNGVGLAYYGGDHSANNDDNLGDYLCKNWVSLHEFGHGYEGNIAGQEYSFVESTNNIMGFYYELTYRPKTDFGWLLGGAKGDEAQWVEEYRKLGKQSEELRNSVSSFDEPGKDTSGPVIDHRNRLFMFTNALDALGPEKTTAAMHSQFRRHYYENNVRPSSGYVILDSFSHAGGYNMVPYFDGWHITAAEELIEEIYDEDLPMLYYLRNLIPDDEAAEAARQKLSEKRIAEGKEKLNGIYSLVCTDDIAGLEENYKSNVKLSVSIDDLSNIVSKNILIKNGEKIAARVPIEAGKTEYNIEIPVGIYEVELPAPREAGYRYEKEYLVAAANIGDYAGTFVEKELSYTKITGDPLVEDVSFWLNGFSWHVVDFILDTEEGKLNCRLNEGTPHSGVDEARYIQITVQDPDGNELWDRTMAGTVKNERMDNEFDFPVGSKLIIYHHENKLQFDSKYTKKDLRNLFFKADNVSKTYTYVMTEYGLMPEWFSEAQRKEAYFSLLCSYSDYLIENVMTESDIANEGRLNNLKQPIRIAYNKLDDAAKEEYDRLYGRLLGHEQVLNEYDKIDLSLLTGTADSSQGGEGPEKALDGKDDTAWHTSYGGNCITDKKNTYTITLAEPRNVSRLEYEPKDGENGRILTYKLEYSTTETGDNFQPVKASRLPAWANDGSRKSVDFEAQNARRIRITALTTAGAKDDSGNGKFMSAKHLWLYEKHERKPATSYLSDLELGMGSNAQPDKKNKTVTLLGGREVTADFIGKEFDTFTAKVSLAEANVGDSFKIYNGEGEGSKLLYQFEKTDRDTEEEFALEVSGIRKLRFEVSGGKAVLSNAKFGNQDHKKNIYMVKGDTGAVSANMSLNSSVVGLTEWNSLNSAVAAVDENGIITAAAKGNTVIREQTGDKDPLECSVYVGNTLEEVIQAIKTIQSAKKRELSGYKDAGQYNAEGKVLLTAEINAGCEAIDAAMNVSGIEAALKEAKEKLDAIADIMDQKAEELRQKKEEAKQELSDYKDSADYRKEQRQELKRAIAEGWLSISQEETLENVEEALANAKKALDSILTDWQMTREELRTTLTDVRRRIESLEESDYSEAAWERLQTKMSEADILLNDEDAEISELKAGKTDLLAALQVLLKPQEVKDAETALKKVIDEYAGLVQSDYQAESWTAYQTALAEARKYLPGGENEQFTNPDLILEAIAALTEAREAMEPYVFVLDGDWEEGLRAADTVTRMEVIDGKMNLTGIGGNNDPATFVCTETFDFSKDGFFEFDLENYTSERFGVYLDYSVDDNFGCGLCMFTEGTWKAQDYETKSKDHYYGASEIKAPQSPEQKQHVKVVWTAEGKYSLYIDGKMAFENLDGTKNADGTLKKSPQGKIAFRRARGAMVTVSNIRPLKRQMLVNPSAINAVTAKAPIKLSTQYRSITDQGTKAAWNSSNEDVAYVDRIGNIYFVAPGEAEITATATLSDDSTHTAENVRVNLPSEINAEKAEDSRNDELIKNAWANTNANSGSDGPASYAIDGNINTKWHSQYNGFAVSENKPAKLTFEFAHDLAFSNQIRFLQNASTGNGFVKKYQIVVGDEYDVKTHEIVDCKESGIQRTEGTIVDGGTDWVTVTLPESKDTGGRLGRYLQIRILEGHNNFACIREIAASFQKNFATDTDEQSFLLANGQYIAAIKDLEGKILEAENADRKDYTEENWQALQQAVTEAEQALDSGADKSVLEEKEQALSAALLDKESQQQIAITFNWNFDGANEERRYAASGTKVTVPGMADAPKRNGYYFTGKWYTEAGCTNEFSADTPVTADDTLYAEWKREADKTELNETLAKANEALIGRYTQASKDLLKTRIAEAKRIADKKDALQNEVNQAKTSLQLAIDGLVKVYIVTFSWNDAANTITEQDVAAKGYAVSPEDAPQWAGYEPTGKWYGNKKCTDEFQFAATPVTKDLTLYATWNEVVDKSALNGFITDANAKLNGQYTAESKNILREQLSKAQEIADKADATQSEVDQARKALKKALDELEPLKENYTVTFDWNYEGDKVQTQSVPEGGYALALTKADAPEWDGFEFTGKWYTEPSCQNEFLFGETPITSNGIILYAGWVRDGQLVIRHAVTFDWNYTGAQQETVYVEDGGNVALLTQEDAPKRNQFEFTGKWYTEPACENEFESETVILEDQTLYAKWVELGLAQAKQELEEVLAQAAGLVQADYSQTAWNVLQAAIAKAQAAAAEETLSSVTSAKEELAAAMANTKVAEARAALQRLYDDYKDCDEDLYTEESFAALETALEEAKTVLDNPEAALNALNAAKTALEEAIAKLTTDVAVTFNWNYEGAETTQQSVEIGGKLTAPTNIPDRTGYEFTGKWYKEPSCQTEIDFANETVTKNMTLYAGWEEIINNEADKTELREQITAAEGMVLGHYTTESLDLLKEEIAKAKEIEEKANASQTEVDQAAERLKNAVESLVPLFTVTFHWNYEGAATETIDVARGGHAAALTEAPVRTGFEFTGLWYTDSECTKEYIFEDSVVTKDFDLYAGWIAVSEEEIEAAKEALNTMLAEAEKLAEADFSESGWERVQKAIEAARKAIDAGTLTGINKAKKELETAMAYTKEVETAEKKETLSTLYQQFTGDDYDEASYTPETWESFEEALLKAKSVLDQDDASLEAIIEAIADLQETAENLVLKPDIVVDKTKLTEAIKQADSLLSGKYTEKSLKLLIDRLEAAKAVEEKINVTQKAVDNAAKSLEEAIAGLVRLYTVTFNWNYTGGKTVAKEVEEGGLAVAPSSVPVRNGYTFTKKWYLDQNGKTEFHIASEKVQKDMTLYAGWKKNSTNQVPPSNNKPAADDDYSIVEKIQFAQSKYEIVKGKSINLEKEIVSMFPEDPENEELIWSSSNTKVATVDKSRGIVKTNKSAAKKTAVITVKNADNKIVASVKVKVMNGSVSKIRPKGKKVLTVKAGKSIKLKAIVSVKGKKPFNKKLKWVSSNTKIATVSSKIGLTTKVKIAKGAGKNKSVKITAVSTDGTNKKLVFKLKVK